MFHRECKTLPLYLSIPPIRSVSWRVALRRASQRWELSWMHLDHELLRAPAAKSTGQLYAALAKTFTSCDV